MYWTEKGFLKTSLFTELQKKGTASPLLNQDDGFDKSPDSYAGTILPQ
jgi:hypothetical protein